MKSKMKEALWILIERHYNVDRKQPQVLTAKFPASSNQIDRIGEEFAEFLEDLLQAATIVPVPQMEEEEVELTIDLDDDSSYPEDLFLDLDDMSRDGTEDDVDGDDDPLAPWWI